MTERAVVIVGGGPSGLTLAAELALAGIDVQVLERRPDQVVLGSRAGGLHARTIEVFDQRGIAERFVSQGQKVQAAGFSGVTFDLSDFPTRHPYTLALWQPHIERILAAWVGELGVTIDHGREVVGLTQDDSGVDVSLADGTTLRARYLVGCDGGRSAVRKAAGIAFVGSDATTSNLIAEVELAEEPPKWGIHRDAVGIHGLSKLEDGRVRVLVTEQSVAATGEPTLDDLSRGLIAVFGSDYGVRNPTWLSRFTDAVRQAATYRDRRVLLAGDAAHVHPPDGGQGIQMGVQDAVNLGWKLAQVLNGTSPDPLLDSYHRERHPVAARALRLTLASVALRREDDRTKALRETITELVQMDEPRKRFAATMSGLDIRYDLGDGHPLLGRRMPDLDLVTPDGTRRAYELLHRARPALIELRASDTPDSTSALDIAPWSDRVQHVVATTTPGPWSLPAIGPVPAPAAVLVRPDGHVAWVGDGTATGLAEALTIWFGPAR